MDPNETLRRIDEFIRDRHVGRCVDRWCEHLYQWIKNGGFKPDWDAYSSGTAYYRIRKTYMDKLDYDPVDDTKSYIPYVICSSAPAGKHVIYRDGVRVTLYEAILRLNELKRAAALAG